MNKSGNFGMACHQAVSFHRLMMRIPKGKAIFWPGCALMNLDPKILEKTLEMLRRKEPDIRLAAGCCGQPTVYLFPEKALQRKEKLLQKLQKQGIHRIYTACPNCTWQLRQMDGFEIIPIWPILAECMTAEDVKDSDEKFIWHDPCPTRLDPAQREGARKLLAISGCDYLEPEHTGSKTLCCGNFHMLRATDPEKSALMRGRRLEELDSDRIILSSCEGCLDAFRSEGRQTRHLLELLFGKSKSRSWANRIRTTLKTPID